MYGFYNDETRRAGCEKTAEAHRTSASLFPIIRKVFEQFDGKVFNCRLEKALRDATERRIFVIKRELYIEVYMYLDDYRGNSVYNLAFVKCDTLKDGKRISAAAFIDSARSYRENHLREAAQMDAAPETAPELVKQIEYFVAQANKLIDSMPYSVQEMYHVSRVR